MGAAVTDVVCKRCREAMTLEVCQVINALMDEHPTPSEEQRILDEALERVLNHVAFAEALDIVPLPPSWDGES